MRSHSGNFSQQPLYLYSFRTKSSASLFLLKKKTFTFSKEIMRHAGFFFPNNHSLISSSEKKFFSEEIMKHAGNIPQQSLCPYFHRKNSSASLFLRRKSLFFFEEIMRHASSVPNNECLIISSEKMFFV